MFDTLLIANRGEIACRVVRTARRMGIATVAVYSDADAGALHVRTADRAIRIGPAPARESYLNIPAVIEAARRSGAGAIHPGYGFLSENPEFAEACAEAGLVFVGPPASAMRAMGSKAAAKALMARSGVPLLPGYHGDEQGPDHLFAEASRTGYPLVIKAVAGGGGRGMRVVREEGEFATALASARQEAASSFGDDRVLIERYLDRPRHIEVQVFADSHGNAVHLFERDCSAQRRHQKVIEEAPAPGLDPATRAAMGEAAVAAARAVGYVGAGTVEFVSDGEGFFFLEMNTRLQVEHPVTEAVTGFDLVEWQLRVAAGDSLPATQAQIRLDGHAMEARLYAEDSRSFAPSTGRLAAFHMPSEARVDAGFAAGDVVPIHYDAMLAKLIVHGATRGDARRKLLRALAECEVAGVASNIDLLTAIAAHPVFAAGAPDTGFIEREMATLMPHRAPPPEALAVAALALLVAEREDVAEPHSPWSARDGWWLNASPVRVLEFSEGEATHRVGVQGVGEDWTLTLADRRMAARATRDADGAIAWTLDGVRGRARATRLGPALILRLAGATWRFRLPDDPVAHAEEDEGAGRLTAPIPGQVTQVLAEPGQAVARGETLVVLEAMKTVFRLNAPADAVVEHVSCRVGETVEEGQVLVSFAETAEPD